MKKLILLFILLLASTNIFADKIPGYFEFDISGSKFESKFLDYNPDIYTTRIGFKYGAFEDSFIHPYVFSNIETYFKNGSNLSSNHPFMSSYRIGFGVFFNNTFYFRYIHQCDHEVISRKILEDRFHSNYAKYPKDAFDKFEFGIRIKID